MYPGVPVPDDSKTNGRKMQNKKATLQPDELQNDANQNEGV